MAEPIFVLVPSVLLGPVTWESTAGALRRLGSRVRVPSLQCVGRAAAPYWPAGVDAIVQSAGGDPVVLVPHSSSGVYVSAVTGALGEQVRGGVFVDAVLPGTGAYAQRDFLNSLVDADGYLLP